MNTENGCTCITRTFPGEKAHSEVLRLTSVIQQITPTSFQKLTQSKVPGARVRNPAHGKGHEEGSPTKRKGVIWLQGFPLSFPEHLPPETRVCLPYCTVLFHSSDILWKKVIQGFRLLHQLKPLWWLSNLPDRFPQTFYNLWIAHSPLTMRGTKLKAY